MFRRWLSGFIQANGDKIKNIFKVVFIVVIFILATYGIFSSTDNSNNETIANEKEIYRPTDSIIYGSNIDQQEYQEDDNMIDRFITYCNEKNIEEAYNLLTDNCKNVLYPTIEEFNERYYKNYFTEKRDYNLQLWVNNGNYVTYRMRIIDDILSTGNYEDSVKYQDYITIVNNNGEKKINVNGFIETTQINKTTEKDGIVIKIINVNTFMDYQNYILEIKNNTDNTILLDSMRNARESIRVYTSNGNSYKVEESSVNTLILRFFSKQTKEIEIKFEKPYTASGQLSNIKFKNIITNYEEYEKNEDEYEGIIEIKVEI